MRRRLETYHMTSNFPAFARAVNARFNDLSQHELFFVEPTDLFATYLLSFPDGTDPIFRVNTEHTCSCCKNFVRNLGRVVAIIDGKIETVWGGLGELPYPYNAVAQVLDDAVKQLPIAGVYRTKERQYGAEQTREYENNITWNHFWGRIAFPHYSPRPDESRGQFNTTAQVLRRGLTELRAEDLDTVLELIDTNALYRGAEHRASVVAFRELQRAYDGTDNFVWANLDHHAARFRNTVIGTLLVDLAEGKDLEYAVRAFETKVAPQNYKRTTALITPKMIDAAVDKLRELDLEGAIDRRFAKLSDVSVNNVLFVDNSVQDKMRDGLKGMLLENAAKPAPTKAEPIGIDDFLATVVPQTTSLELVLDNAHVNNFVSLTAPNEPAPACLFKWNNDFAWSYDGEVADSIKQRVKSAGGNVDAKLRVSLAWFNYDDLDLHAHTPKGTHIFFGNKAGILDVDMNAGSGTTREPVENLAFTSLVDGVYKIVVKNYWRRETVDVGFDLEVESGGRSMRFNCAKALASDAKIEALSLIVENGELVSVEAHKSLKGGSTPIEKWGVKTNTPIAVDTLMASPNHWDGQEIGNKHWFFILKGCKNPEPARGIYNEFLRPSLEPHRKVFEVLGSKTKCPPTDDQLSGVGFSSTRKDKVRVIARGPKLHRAFDLQF